jgi:hypothetical protein
VGVVVKGPAALVQGVAVVVEQDVGAADGGEAVAVGGVAVGRSVEVGAVAVVVIYVFNLYSPRYICAFRMSPLRLV